jgi:Ca-activated chloride channel family protein
MWGRAGGEIKIVTARKVLGELASTLPENSQVGLIAYGHRREADCADIETVVPMGPLDRASLASKVQALNPKGKTPVTQSIEQAVAAAKAGGKSTTIVLLSDGIETCAGDPCAAVTKAKQSGVNFLLHVIGFDLSKENVSQLECAAQAGGGLYFSVENAGELSAALDQAVTVKDEAPADSALSVKAMINGELADVAVQVTDARTGKPVAGGRTYKDPATNPRKLPLPAGAYDVSINAVGLRGTVNQRFNGVVIAKGATVEKLVDFSTGEVAVHVLRNGELSDATIYIYQPGTRTPVMGGRSYRAASSNPKVFEISPGAYDIQVGSVEIEGVDPRRFEKVEVKAGERVERKVEFASGDVLIGARQAGTLVDAVVNVHAPGNRQSIAAGRTYTDPRSNPKRIVLQPGRYVITVAPVRPAGLAPKDVELEVATGQTVERIVEF